MLNSAGGAYGDFKQGLPHACCYAPRPSLPGRGRKSILSAPYSFCSFSATYVAMTRVSMNEGANSHQRIRLQQTGGPAVCHLGYCHRL